MNFRMRLLRCSFFLSHRMVAVFSIRHSLVRIVPLSRDTSKHFQAAVLYLPIMRREIISGWVDG